MKYRFTKLKRLSDSVILPISAALDASYGDCEPSAFAATFRQSTASCRCENRAEDALTPRSFSSPLFSSRIPCRARRAVSASKSTRNSGVSLLMLSMNASTCMPKLSPPDTKPRSP